MRQPAVDGRYALDRRRFLALGAGALGAATSVSALGTRAWAQPQSGSFGFALLGDTQIDMAVPDRTAWVRWVYEQIAAADPPVVTHVGDIVEYGSVEEYETYLGTIPVDLRPRVRHVPGNHEWRWDPTARERYEELFGPTRYSFDAGGMHFVGLDPSHLLQEPGGFGAGGIAWLTSDLDRVPPDVPIILMCHFPFGGANYYVSDQERLLEVVARYNVRAILAGHVHTQRLGRFNGTTQLTVDDARGSPVYYWAERVEDDDGAALQLTVIRRGADGEPESQPVAEIPLTGPRAALGERPQRVGLDRDAWSLGVSVRLAPRADALTVEAQLYPQHVYGTRTDGDWHELSADGSRRYTGTLDIAALPPGTHRMTVRVTDSTDAWYEQTQTFTVPGADRVGWQRDLREPIQAGLAAADEMVVAATSGGAVHGVRPTRAALRRRWQVDMGPVHGRPVFTPSGDTVYVPSADHHLHALDAASGRERYAYDAGAPVLGSPLVTEVDGGDVVVVTAGEALHAIEAESGARLWTANEHGAFLGRPASDGARVYVGGSHGDAYAYEADTGAVAWSFSTNERTTAYTRFIYGPWYDTVEFLPGDLVLVSTVVDAFALDAETGEVRWSRGGSYIYAPASVLDDGDLLLIDDFRRTATRVDAETGEERWTAGFGARALNTGAAIHDGLAWIQGTTGLLVAIDLESGEVQHELQLTTTAYCYSTPVVVGDTLVVGDQDGILHGIDVR